MFNSYYDEVNNTSFIIANRAEVITRQLDSLLKQYSCINFTFYTGEISNYIQSQQTIRESTGSDLSIIYTSFKLSCDTTCSSRHDQYNLDWQLADTEVKERLSQLLSIKGDSDTTEAYYNTILDSITCKLTQNTSLSRPTIWSKKNNRLRNYQTYKVCITQHHNPIISIIPKKTRTT